MTRSKTIRVVLAEDHHVVRRALCDHLQRDPLIEVVGEVADGADLLAALAQYQPDVLLMDVKMPNHHPIQLVPQIREAFPALKVVVLSMHKEAEYVLGLFKAGVDGYILKDDPSGVPSQALHQVMKGERWISSQAASVLAGQLRNPTPAGNSSLTNREMEILAHVARGQRNEDIAEELCISEHTVRNHIANIFTKLSVETRVEAVVYALSLGLISLDRASEEFKERFDPE